MRGSLSKQVFVLTLGWGLMLASVGWAGDPNAEPNQVIVPPCRSYGFTRTGEFAIAVTGVQAQVHIDANTVAETTLIFHLTNRSDQDQSAELLVPAPNDVDLEVWQSGQGDAVTVPGHMLSKSEATDLCGKIVVEVNDPALMEFVDTKLFRSAPFVIHASSDVVATVTYRQTLGWQGYCVKYMLKRTEFGRYQVPWDVSVSIDAGYTLSTIYSPSHHLNIQKVNPSRAQVTAVDDPSTRVGPFRLYYLLQSSEGFTSTVLTYPSREFDGGYFVFLAGLPANVPDDGNDIKREVTLVLDRSGSMRGQKIEQVKDAARQVISGLADGGAFNLITYNATVDTFNSEPLIKSDATVQAAFDYLNPIEASGGTNLYDALKTALLQKPTPGYLPLILFLTDGLPTVGETREVQIRDLVLSSNPYNRRVYTLGVGYDLNAPLLDGLADYSLARSMFVTPEDDVSAAIQNVFSSVSKPLFVDLGITSVFWQGDLGAGRSYNVLPFAIPDLFQGDQLVLIGQYTGQEPFYFEILGNYHNQNRYFDCPMVQAEDSGRNDFVPRLWSDRVVAQVINEIRQLGADPELSRDNQRLEDLSAAMVDLSLRWGTLTEYTAFFGNGTVDLLNYGDLLYYAWNDLYNRAVRSRTGKPGVNQSLNLNNLKYQSVLNWDNVYLDRNMNEVRTTSIQYVNDLALYNYGGTWLDSQLLMPPSDPNMAIESVDVNFGSPEFMALAQRLASRGEQGCLAMPESVILWESDKVTTVHMPYPVCHPNWLDVNAPGQITTPK